MLKQTLHITVFLVFFCLPAMAQQKNNKGVLKEERSLLYNKEFSVGGDIHSNGFGLNYTKGKFLNISKTRIWEIDLVSMAHPKEYQSNSIYSNGESYVYGKLNGLAILRGGFGIRQVIFSKAERDGVEIRYAYSGGFSLGIAKPVYYEIVTGKNEEIELVDMKFDVNKTGQGNIYGKSSFFKGFDEISLHPGLYAKLGITFDYDKHDERIKRIETGVVLDAYTSKIPILALAQNNQLFLSFYINFSLGKKWNDKQK